ncbi:hypothetical protein ENUP19_0166G0016 [Entamoeba nuttalli]|uniref:Uncharacterized protein n=2 Tax=Entamoeba nuttalli TaxID=412467 RepID=K2GTU9_ENTNP|nr:hypothetical protein ENU1_204730 [Entamoeba nuttalli P19]EKE37232.1 hypothetical protein ENU1_204730 [Entamoeba nuttalli P19]|eukprot:XP_008860442.1 hypothetical protein ENU1_204730 [Entamoeba nuttalli P19]
MSLSNERHRYNCIIEKERLIIKYFKTEMENIKAGTNYLDTITIFSKLHSKGQIPPIPSHYPTHSPLIRNPILQKIVEEELLLEDPNKSLKPIRKPITMEELKKRQQLEPLSYYQIIKLINTCREVFQWIKKSDRYIVRVEYEDLLNCVLAKTQKTLSVTSKFRNSVKSTMKTYFKTIKIKEKMYWLLGHSFTKYGEIYYCKESDE